MNGSNLPPANPGRRAQGRVLLFENNDGEVRRTADVAGGEASQGIVFAADGEHVLVQFNVEQQIAVYAVNGGQLTDTGVRIGTPGGPASLRARPR
jgi:DNA-binding beta-propeller fold protein YncE